MTFRAVRLGERVGADRQRARYRPVRVPHARAVGTEGEAVIAADDRIAIDPAVWGGRPIIAGTRVRVGDVLEMLAGGATAAEIVEDFPYLAEADVSAALAYAATAITAARGGRPNCWAMVRMVFRSAGGICTPSRSSSSSVGTTPTGV